MDPLFLGLALIIILGAFLSYIARLLKQPIIPAYVLAGLLIGPAGASIIGNLGVPKIAEFLSNLTITNLNTIATLSEIGVALMLFIVGLELDLKKLKSVTSISTIGAPIQIIALFLLGCILAIGFGFRNISIIYIGLFISFSSTVIVIKILSDKKELDTLHGRIIIGILLMEDFFAIISITLLSALGSSIMLILFALLKAILIIGIAFMLAKYLFPSIFEFAAKSRELLFILSIAVCFLFGAIFIYIGFSMVIGTFVAGLVLGNLEYNIEIASRIKSLRDFFSMIFFVSLGLNLNIITFGNLWVFFSVLFVFIILIKPIIIIMICSLFGYKKHVSFLTATSLAQTSEFSLIIAAQGLYLGHIDNKLFALATLLTMATMTTTSYSLKFEGKIYNTIKNLLGFFERSSPIKSDFEHIDINCKHDIVLCGCNRIGFSILKSATEMKKRTIVVDYNPEVIKELSSRRIHCIYGDVGDVEILDRLDLKNAKILVSTVTSLDGNLLLLKKSKAANPGIVAIMASSQIDGALKLYEQGADYVIIPLLLSGERAAEMLSDFDDVQKLVMARVEHIAQLKKRTRGIVYDFLTNAETPKSRKNRK